MPQTITTVRFYKETGLFGYEIAFEGGAPHHGLNTCDSTEWALLTCDPHQQLIWEEVNDPESGVLMISRRYKPGSVLERMRQYEEARGQQIKSPWQSVSATVAASHRHG